MKTTTASVLASMLAPFLMMLAPHGANSHAVEVVSCVTSENKLRIFVEHWHDWLSSPSGASFDFSVNGSSPQRMSAIGRVTSVSDASQLPGCVSECTTLGSTCAGQTDCGYYGSDCEGYDDWVWFDFEATDTVELVSSGGGTLNPGCDGLYPVTISAATGTCATGCSCDELGQQCCIDGSPSEYEVCVRNDAEDINNLVTITKQTAPGTKCCVHTETPKRIVLQHAALPCP